MTTRDDIARRLAARVGPALRRTLAAREPAIAAGLSWPARLALKLAWPAIDASAPVMVEAAIDAALEELGSMTLAELAVLAAGNPSRPAPPEIPC